MRCHTETVPQNHPQTSLIRMEHLQSMLNLSKIGVQEGNSESLVRIKNLYKQLMHEAFKKGDSLSYSALIQTAIEFVFSLEKEKQYAFLTTIFDVEKDDIPLAVFALQDKEYLTWLMIQWHDLDEYCLKDELDGDTIQGFLKEAQSQCLDKDYMPKLVPHIEELKKALANNSLEQISIHYGVITTIIHDAFYRGDANIVADVLESIYPIIIDLAKHDRFELISKFLELDSDEIVDFRVLFKANNRNLSLWHLLENFELEQLATEMASTFKDIQSFKREVLHKLKTLPALKSLEQLLAQFLQTQEDEEETLVLLKMELIALLRQVYLDNDVMTYAQIIQVLYEQAKNAYQQKNYVMLQFLLDLNPQELEIFTHLVSSGEDDLARLYIMQFDDLEQLAWQLSTRLDYKDTERVKEFRQAAIEQIFGKNPKLNSTQIIKSLLDVHNSALYDQKVLYGHKMLLRIKINLMLDHAYQKNSPDEYINNIQAFVTLAKALFYPKNLDILIELLDMDQYNKERIIASFDSNDLNYAVYLYAQSQQYRIQGSLPLPLPYLHHFHEQVNEKLAIKDDRPFFYYVPEDEPIHYLQENAMETWRSMFSELATTAPPQQFLRIKEQMKKKLIKSFEEDDAQTYSEMMQLALNFLKAALENNRFGHFALAFELDSHEIQYLKRLVDLGDEEGVKLFFIQSHELQNYVTDKQPIHHINSFLTKVMKLLEMAPEAIASEDKINSITNKLNFASKNQNYHDLRFHYNQLIKALYFAISINDSSQVAVIIQQLASTCIHTHHNERAEHVQLSQLLGLTNDELEVMNQLIDTDLEQYLGISMLSSICVLHKMRQGVSDKEINAVITSTAEKLGYTKERVQKIISAQIAEVKRAVFQDEDKKVINHLNVLDQALNLVFLSGDVESVALAVNQLYETALLASQYQRTDLIIHHLRIDDDYVELLDRFHQDEPISEASINLFKYVILEAMAFEHTAAKAFFKNSKTQAFKKEVQHQITGNENILLTELDTLMQQVASIIDKDKPSLEEMTFLVFQLECHLQYAFEQEDVTSFSKILEEINSILHYAKVQGQELALVKILDLQLDQRMALLHHLRHGDKSASLHILIDAEIEDKSIGLAEKQSVQDSFEFRLNVYHALAVLPPELDNGYLKNPIIKGVKVAYDNQFHDQALGWLMSHYKDFDLTNEFNQKILIGLAKGGAYPLADAFLQAVNGEHVVNLREILAELRFMHMFNHHLNLRGTREVQGIVIDVEGGFESDMVQQLKESVTSFTGTPPEVYLAIQGISVPDNADNLISQLKKGEIINIPVNTTQEKADVSGFEYHATNVTFFDDFCLIADRSRNNDEEQGIFIFRIKNKEPIKKIVHELSQTAYIPHHLSSDALLLNLVNMLELEKLAHIKLLPQLAGSCTWSSCAEMIHLATAFAVMYRQNKFYNEDRRIEVSMEQAQHYHNDFIKHDALQMLDNYLNVPRTSAPSVDKLSLALAYLKFQRHPELNEIAKKIDKSGLITQNDIERAFEHFVDGFKIYFCHELTGGMQINETILDKVAREAITHFVENRVDKAIELFNSLLLSTQKLPQVSTLSIFAQSGIGENENTNGKCSSPMQGTVVFGAS